jgi:hypothetical protein
MERPESNPSQIYEITVRSELGERWPRLLDGLGHTVEVRCCEGCSTSCGT